MGSNWMMVMLVVSLFGPTPVARAIDTTAAADTGWVAGGSCHPLLMAAECVRHQAMLATLPVGPERERYLAELRALILDREQACSTTRHAEMVILQPGARLRQTF